MRRVITMIKREYFAAVRGKGFILGLLVAPLVFGGSAIGIALLGGQVDTTDRKIAVIDHTGLVAESLIQEAEQRNAREVKDPASGKKVKPAFLLFSISPDAAALPSQRLALSREVDRGTLHGFVEIGASVLHPDRDSLTGRITYHAKNPAADDVRWWLSEPINDRLRWARLQEAGVGQEDVPDLLRWVSVEPLGLVSKDDQTGEVQAAERKDEIEALIVPLIMAGFMLLLMMISAAPMLSAVMEEKNQRIAEVVLGLASPFEFMLGKVLGALLVSLTGGAFYLIASFAILLSLGGLGYLPLVVLPWFFTFLILGIVLFGSMQAALGSVCSDPKDAQSMAFPAMLPVILPMFIIVPVLREPQSSIATLLSLVPPFTPLLMLVRMSTPEGVPGWQPWVGTAILLAATVSSVWLAARVFRVGILTQGKLPKPRQMLQWALKG